MSITELASSEILTELCNNLDNINFLSKINNISNLNEEFWLSFIYLKDFKKLGGGFAIICCCVFCLCYGFSQITSTDKLEKDFFF